MRRGGGKGWVPIALAVGLVVGAGLPAGGQTPRQGGTYQFSLGPSDPPSLDPAHVTDTTSHSVVSELFDGLVEFDPQMRIQPAIAERWEISPDGRTYRFRLRKGVRFQNGREVNAEDFRYSFLRVLDPKTKSERTWILDKLEGAAEFLAGKAADVRGILVRDRSTLELRLAAPFAPFLTLLAYPAAMVVPRETVERAGPDFSARPVGTGPFRLAEWRRDDRLVLTANPDYFRGRPHLDRIVFRIIPDELTRLQEFRAGTFHHTDVPAGLYQSIAADPALRRRLHSQSILGIQAVRLNVEAPPFAGNRKLRQALNHAVDKGAFAQVIMEGRVKPAIGILPPGMPGYSGALRGYAFDRPRARQLLAEAGYPDGKGLPPLTLHYNTSLTNRRLAEFVQAQLAEVGVKVELAALDWPAYLKLVDAGQTQMHRMGWIADYPDPENFLTVLFHSRNIGERGNTSRYRNSQVDALLDKADRTTRETERFRLYQQAEQLIVEDAPWIFLTYYSTDLLVHPAVQNLVEQLSPMDSSPSIGLVQMRLVWLAE
ncbi:MAG: ABC transporter substrate-binding protein [candidate division NC10 bacterium]|nr:ABC transporter substrate-binding protein [candidate division NC10 bacterium]